MLPWALPFFSFQVNSILQFSVPSLGIHIVAVILFGVVLKLIAHLFKPRHLSQRLDRLHRLRYGAMLHSWHWSHLYECVCVLFPPTYFCTTHTVLSSHPITTQARPLVFLMHCTILGIHGSLIQLLLGVSGEHAQCLRPPPKHNTQPQCSHVWILFSTLQYAQPSSVRGALGCHLCLCVRLRGDELSNKSLVKIFRMHDARMFYNISVKMQWHGKDRVQSIKPSRMFFHVFASSRRAAQDRRIGGISQGESQSDRWPKYIQ